MILVTTGQRPTKITKVRRCGGNHGCGKWLPVDAFNRKGQGWQQLCRVCQGKYKAQRLLTPKGRALELWLSARNRAKKADIPFTITREWVSERVERGVSELTGMPIVLEPHERYHHHPAAPSLDQKEAGKGYTPENTMLVCAAENQIMNQYRMEIVRVYCAAILKATDGEYDGPCDDN